MLHIVGCAQKGIGLRAPCDPVHLELLDKQQHLTSTLPVMDVPLSSGRVRCCGALDLPVEQVFVDGIILIHGGGRVSLSALFSVTKNTSNCFSGSHFTPSRTVAGFKKFNAQLVTGIGIVRPGGQSKPRSTGSSMKLICSYR